MTDYSSFQWHEVGQSNRFADPALTGHAVKFSLDVDKCPNLLLEVVCPKNEGSVCKETGRCELQSLVDLIGIDAIDSADVIELATVPISGYRVEVTGYDHEAWIMIGDHGV